MANVFSQFYIINLRGEVIISRDYRNDIARGANEVFFQGIKLVKSDAHPVFTKDQITFCYLKASGVYLVLTTLRNVSPFYAIELLQRLISVIKDYCGIATEESIRKNFVLIYELLDEILDFGVVQTTTTEALRGFIHSEPVLIQESGGSSGFEHFVQTQLQTAPGQAANRSVQLKNNKEEIFIDLLEKLTVVFSSTGSVLSARIDGQVVMRSFLKGNPDLRLQLNEDLTVGKGNARSGRVNMDDVLFHECARTSTFEMDRSVSFHPPDGEFVLMSYRVSDDVRLPFHITAFFEERDGDNRKIDVIVKVRLDVPQQNISACNIVITLPVPKTTTSAHVEVPKTAGHSYEYLANDKQLVWHIKKFTVGEQGAKFRVLVSAPMPNPRREFGNMNMMFELPMYSCSDVNIRALKTNDNSPIPYRWVRYITQSSSYIQRL